MEIGREIFWNIGEGVRILVYSLALVSILVLFYGIARRVKMWKIGKRVPLNFGFNLGKRISYYVVNGIFHGKILKEKYPGFMHLFIFFGFLLLFIGTALIAIEDDIFKPLTGSRFILGNFYLLFSFILDLAGVAAILGVLLALWRRYVEKPKRLDNIGDDLLSLLFILFVLLTGFLVEALRIAALKLDAPFEIYSFFGYFLSGLFNGMEKRSLTVLHKTFWYIHMLSAFGLISYIAYSKLVHIVTSSFNMMLRGIEKKGVVAPIEDFENLEEFGTNKISGLTLRQIIDLDSCTRCGRCQDLCPAYQSEKPLSPKKFIQDLKREWEAVARKKKEETELIGNLIEEETIWSCTSCLACEVNCPVSIPTFDKNIEFRRYLSMTLSAIPSETKLLYKNLQQKQDPYGMGKKQREDWYSGLEIKNVLEDEVEVLYWTGCVASLDERNKKVAKAFSEILKRAGVNFGILGSEEKCCGDSARRLGNEDLYLTLAQTNIEILNEAKVKRIVTTCPHCYNIIKNEYPQLGGKFEVYHHTEFLFNLVKEGKLKIESSLQGIVTYHDPCYLGRINRIFDEPRELIKHIKTDGFVEMERNHDRSFCCGGGGGRIWMEEHHKRINHLRIDEAIKISANKIVTACPYCLIMMEDAIKDKGMEEAMQARDISELIL